MDIETLRTQLRKGLLVLAILQTIHTKKRYSSDILEALKQTTFATSEGTLYPLLSKLKREGLLDYEWVESASGPPRKYYILSDKGNAYRIKLLEEIDDIKAVMNTLGEK